MLQQSTHPLLTPSDLSTPEALLSALQTLRQSVEQEGLRTFEQWRSHIRRPEFLASALNLAEYLALRRHDLRPIQRALMPWGLSSLGRIEARVMPNLDAVIATLKMLCNEDRASPQPRPPIDAFFEGHRLLRRNTEALFGSSFHNRRVRIMVTFPTEAASHYDLVRDIVGRGANCARINCAHDTPEVWQAMIDHVRRAERKTGNTCKIMMDLGGPKIRTGPVWMPPDKTRVFVDDFIVLTREQLDEDAVSPTPLQHEYPQTCSTVPEILDQLQPNSPVYIDDGKIRTRVVEMHHPLQNGSVGLLLKVTQVAPKGAKLKPEKGLNFPDQVLSLRSLTDKDLEDLDFAALKADIIGYSFVQQPEDIELLQNELAKRCQAKGSQPAIVAKIENQTAVSNLPDLIIRAAGKQAFGVMIARGDLAVEIGYQRLAEIQEEILWLCEAAHVPVIWATQVLENLVKKGAPSRGEMTDAAMAERAECVMLNKGPFIAQGITILDDVLTRMEAHQLKKTSQMRALHSWQ